jgi:hypothetical protein
LILFVANNAKLVAHVFFEYGCRGIARTIIHRDDFFFDIQSEKPLEQPVNSSRFVVDGKKDRELHWRFGRSGYTATLLVV